VIAVTGVLTILNANSHTELIESLQGRGIASHRFIDRGNTGTRAAWNEAAGKKTPGHPLAFH
jgi:hypothetical protein